MPDKNIRMCAGRPLLAWSIAHALASTMVTRTVVSTDSEAYATIARTYGAEVPFLRPAAHATDTATDVEVFAHALRWLEEHQGYRPDICVHLRPTHPVRDAADIDRMVTMLINQPDVDAVRSVVVSPETPFKMWFRDEAGMLTPVIQSTIAEAWNQPRQILPVTYLQNASIDVVRAAVIRDHHSMTGRRIVGYVMKTHVDIDSESDFERAERMLSS